VKVEYAVPCRGIEQLANGTYIAIGAEANAFGATSLPQHFGVFLLTCIVQSHPRETTGQLTGRILDPSMEPAGADLQVGFEMHRSPLLPEGWSSRILAPIQIVFEARSYGGYSVELSTGGSSLSVPLLVFEPPSS
jgi:hypothetical protein